MNSNWILEQCLDRVRKEEDRDDKGEVLMGMSLVVERRTAVSGGGKEFGFKETSQGIM